MYMPDTITYRIFKYMSIIDGAKEVSKSVFQYRDNAQGGC